MKINNTDEFIQEVKDKVDEIITVEGDSQHALDTYVEHIVWLYLEDTKFQAILGEVGAEVVVDELVELMTTAVVSALMQLDMLAEKYVDVSD